MSIAVIILLVIALIAVTISNARKVEKLATMETERDEAIRQLGLNRQAHQSETVRAQQLFESLTAEKDRVVALTQDRTVVLANLNKTGAEYSWLINQLDGAHIRIKGKTKNIAQILERMPADHSWAGLVEDVGPFTRHVPEKKSDDPRVRRETSGSNLRDGNNRSSAVDSFHNPSGSNDWLRSSDGCSSSSSDSSSSSSSSSSSCD
jgi:hypothetical protein